MTEFKTKAGTILPLINLKGKPYLQVAHRIVWFREEHKDAPIMTRIVFHDENHSVVEASIYMSRTDVWVNAFKREDKAHFADHLEKASTGAIGRALALIGFGTQFCEQDFDELPRIVDAPTQPKFVAKPVERKSKPVEPEPRPMFDESAMITIPMTAESAGAHVISFGLHNGKLVSALTLEEATIYCGKVKSAIDSDDKIQTSARRDYDAVKTYFGI